jgi:hypothetical protein
MLGIIIDYQKPNERLGLKGLEDFRGHSFFSDISFQEFEQKLVKPPFVPELEGPLDLKYFDKVKENF